MKLTRIIILNLSLALLILSGVRCQDAAGGGGMASCSPAQNLTLGGGATETGTDTTEVAFDGPVDLPVTIAKNISGVDAESVSFTAANLSVSSANFSIASSEATADLATTTIGTLSWSLIDASCSTTAVIISGEIVEQVAGAGEECSFSYSVQSDDLDQPISLSVLGSTIAQGSEPVTALISNTSSATTEYIGSYRLTVFITNLASDATEMTIDVSSTLPMAPITVSSTENFVVQGVDDSNATVAYRIPRNGGPAVEFAELTSSLTTIDTTLSLIFGLDSNGVEYLFNTDGDSLALDLSSLDLESNNIAIDPSGNYMLYEATKTNDSTSNESQFFNIYDIGNDSIIFDFSMDNQPDCDNIELTWVGQTTVAFICYNESPETFAIFYGSIEQIISVESDSFEAAEVTASSAISKPRGDSSGFIYYICLNSGVQAICRYDIENKTGTTFISESDDIINFELSNDQQSFIFYEIDTDPGIIGMYSFDASSTSYTYGSNLSVSRSASNIFAYQYDLNETTQVGLFNTGNDSTITPSALSLSPSTLTMAKDYARTFTASGGLPPYTYSVALTDPSEDDDTGSIDAGTGRFEAAADPADLTITVTDSAGSTATAAVEIAATGPNDQFGDTVSNNGANVFDPSTTAAFNDLYALANGAFITTGYISDGGDKDVVVAKYDSDGTLDTDFGVAAGYTVIDVSGGNDDEGVAIDVMSDGKIAIGVLSDAGLSNQFAAVVLESDGTLDTGFSGDGIVTEAINVNANDNVYDIVVDSDDNVLVIGEALSGGTSASTIVKYTTSGVLDNSFGTSGIKQVINDANDTYARAAVPNIAGDLYIAGYYNGTGDDCYILKIAMDNGGVDASFDSNGIKEFTLAGSQQCNSIQLDSEGNVLVGGTNSASGTSEWFISKVDENGDLDTGFATNGYLIPDAGLSTDELFWFTVDEFDRIYILGDIASGNSALGRLLASGAFDTSFGSNDGRYTFTQATIAIGGGTLNLKTGMNVNTSTGALNFVGYNNNAGDQAFIAEFWP